MDWGVFGEGDDRLACAWHFIDSAGFRGDTVRKWIGEIGRFWRQPGKPLRRFLIEGHRSGPYLRSGIEGPSHPARAIDQRALTRNKATLTDHSPLMEFVVDLIGPVIYLSCVEDR